MGGFLRDLTSHELRHMVAIYEKQVTRNGTDECWGWKGSFDSSGYGKIRKPRERSKNEYIRAHRFSFEYQVRALKPGELVLHECNNPPCTNPNKGHLYAGTHKDNHDDAVKRGTSYRGTLPVLRGDENPSAKITLAQAKQIRELLAQGKWKVDIARELGCSYQTVNNIAIGKTWKHLGEIKYKREPRMEGLAQERKSWSSLTKAQAQKIRRFLEAGEFKQDIAREVGCKYHMVARIATGETWKHLGPVEYKKKPSRECKLRKKWKPGGYKTERE